MKDIILFDIDKTIFDRDSFLNDFYKIFPLPEDVESVYEENKKKFGHFKYKDFLSSLIEKHPDHNSQINSFFETKNIENYLFDDSKVLLKIRNYRLGIWSKGDRQFQKQKINFFGKVLDQKLIYIYQDKIEALPKILTEHKGSSLVIVDDSIEALNATKLISKKITTILIDRNNLLMDTDGIDFRINTLFGIIQFLNKNEKTT